MSNLKQAYLKSKEGAWSYATYKAEASRLAAISETYLPSDPAGLFSQLQLAGYKPYTVKVILMRAAQLVEYGQRYGYFKPGVNEFSRYIQEHAARFKYAYKPRKPSLDFKHALQFIEGIEDVQVKEAALGLLRTGLRISEAQQPSRAFGSVVGKGGAARNTVALPAIARSLVTKLRKELAKVGLTPHALRKLAATRVAELGGREADLLAIFGWRSAQVASYYVQATRSAELLAKLNEEAGR